MTLPAASVIVPTRDGRERVLSCLESLRSQTAEPTDYEVVVVVDGSNDGTAETLRRLTPPFRLFVVAQAATGAAAARNEGAATARGRILIFLDDDVVARPELVATHLDVHRNRENIVALGHVEQVIAPNADRFTRLRAEIRERHHRRIEAGEVTFVDYDAGNCSLPAELFRAVGGYANDLPASEDLELAYRLKEAGARFVFLRAASVAEHDTASWKEIADASRLRGRVDVELYRRHPPLLSHTALGGVGAPGPRKRRVQALLLGLRVPPPVLARAGELAPSRRFGRRILDFADGYSYWWGVRGAADRDLWRRVRSPTVILLYHALTRPGERRSRYVVSARRFAWQMRWLRWRRYSVISLQSYLDSRHEARPPRRRSVVITFDDGYSDNVVVAGPILERHGFPATIFVVTAAGPTNGWSADEPTLADRPLISLSDLETLTGTFEFGAHTRTHIRLDEAEPASAQAEIAGSKRELEATLGRKVDSFAYPFGAYDGAVRDAVEQAGFAGACSVEIGGNFPSTDSFELRRLEVRGGYSLLRFALALARADTRPVVSRSRRR